MGVAIFLQVHHLRTEVADGCPFKGHAHHGHVGGHGNVLLLIHQDVVVAVQLSCEMWHIGYHRRQLIEVYAIQRYRQVLQHRGVLVLRVDLHACTVVGNEVDLGLNLVLFAKEDVVVFVQVELFVAQRRTVWHQLEAYAAFFHLCRRPDTHTHTVVGIKITKANQGSVLVDMAVNKGIEHELGIATVVADLSLVGQTVAFLCEAQSDGVDADTVVVQRVEMALAVDACLWRGGQIDEQFLEIHVAGSEKVGDGIIATALHVHLHGGQESFDGLLVDHLLVELGYDRVCEGVELSEQLLVAAAGIEFHDEVAALCPEIGGVGSGIQQNANVGGSEDAFLVLYEQFAE